MIGLSYPKIMVLDVDLDFKEIVYDHGIVSSIHFIITENNKFTV